MCGGAHLCNWPVQCQIKVMIAFCYSFYVSTAPRSHRYNECQIWLGGLQQFTEAYFDLHSIVHRGNVPPHKVCGGAEGPGNRLEQLQCPHTVLHLCGWGLHLLPHLWIPAGNTVANIQSEGSTHTHVVKCLGVIIWSLSQWNNCAVMKVVWAWCKNT